MSFNLYDFIETNPSTVGSSDTINLWISESIQGGYTSSIIQGLTVPTASTANGNIESYLREANEIVFSLTNLVQDETNSLNFKTSVGTGDFFNITSGSTFINAEYAAGAPATLEISSSLNVIPQQGINITEFNFSIPKFITDYTSDANAGLQLTASLVYGDTLDVIDGKTFTFKHTYYPVSNQSVKLEFLNTGSLINNPELYFRVYIPSSSGAGNVSINLSNITNIANVTSSGYYRSNILTRKRMKGYYYIKLEDDIEVPYITLNYNQSTDFFNVGFVPNNEEKFKNSDYDVNSGIFQINRQSVNSLIIDKKSYSPSFGEYKGFILPTNFTFLAASFVDNIKTTLPDRAFAEIQDSNYSSKTWTVPRYDGAKEDNDNIQGYEPALFLTPFKGIIYPSSSEDSLILSSTGSLLPIEDVKNLFFSVLGTRSGSIGYSSGYFNSGSTIAQPLQYSYENIEPKFDFEKNGQHSTFFFKESEISRNKLDKVTNSKIYFIEKTRIYTTDEVGKLYTKLNLS